MGTSYVPVIRPQILLPAYVLGKQQWMARVLRTLHPCGTPEEPHLWDTAALWRMNQWMKELSLSLLLSINLPLQLT